MSALIRLRKRRDDTSIPRSSELHDSGDLASDDDKVRQLEPGVWLRDSKSTHWTVARTMVVAFEQVTKSHLTYDRIELNIFTMFSCKIESLQIRGVRWNLLFWSSIMFR